MTIFLVLAPFAVFSLLVLVTSLPVSLFSAAAIFLAVVAYDFARGRSIKMLGAGCAGLFTLVGCYIVLIDPDLSVSTAKLAVDSGVLSISLASLAIRRPFTLQYAREVVDVKTAALPAFLTANYIITWAWTGAILLMAIANVLLIYVPSLPLWSGLAIAFAARNSAAYFTKWYPQHHREQLIKRASSAAMRPVS